MSQLSKTFSKIAMFLALGVLTIGLSVFALDRVFEKQGGLGSLSSSLEAIRLRSLHPTMKPEVREPLQLEVQLSLAALQSACAGCAASSARPKIMATQRRSEVLCIALTPSRRFG